MVPRPERAHADGGGVLTGTAETEPEFAELVERHRAELLPTLREFLACSGSWNACAATMYVHVNTVRYRIRRIEELTGRDLSRLDDQVDFFLALRIR